MQGTNKELALETMIFNTVIRAFNEENIPITTASVIMRSVAGRIDNMAVQALTEENFQLQAALEQSKKSSDVEKKDGDSANE